MSVELVSHSNVCIELEVPIFECCIVAIICWWFEFSPCYAARSSPVVFADVASVVISSAVLHVLLRCLLLVDLVESLDDMESG